MHRAGWCLQRGICSAPVPHSSQDPTDWSMQHATTGSSGSVLRGCGGLALFSPHAWRFGSGASPFSAFPFLPASPLGAPGGGRRHAWAAAPGLAELVPRGSLAGAWCNVSIPAKRAFPGLLRQWSRALIGFIMTQNDCDLYHVRQEGCRCHFESLLSCGKGTASRENRIFAQKGL